MTNADYEIGVAARTATDKLLPVVRKEYSFLSSFPAGVSLGVKTLKGYVGQMKYLFSKEGAKQLEVSEPSAVFSPPRGTGTSSGT